MKRTISNNMYCVWWDFVEIENIHNKYRSIIQQTFDIKYVLTNSFYGNKIRGLVGRYIGYL